MKNNDRRSRRIALVADAVLNPRGNQPDLMDLLVEYGWGIVALPPESLGRAAIARWMAGVADQVAEFQRHGMTVVALLDGDESEVIGALERAVMIAPQAAVPTLVVPAPSSDQVATFLRCHEIPDALP